MHPPGQSGVAFFVRVRRGWRIGFFIQNVRLSPFEVSLAHLGSLLGVSAHGQIRSFDEIPPSFVVGGRALRSLEILQRQFGILLSTDDGNDTSRAVGADVMQDNGVGSLLFFSCQ